MVRIENNIHMLDSTCQVAFLRFCKLFGTFSHKVVQTWFVCHEIWHTTLFRIYYCVEKLRIENNNPMIDITFAKLRF